jgi:hypothetical protein
MRQSSSTRLASIEAELQDHFQRLRESKGQGADASPLFAIEHGLDDETAASLGERLGSSMRDIGYMSPRHQLTWVVHAAERGYNFTGLEYWNSFAQATPGWLRHGSRETLRDYFDAFSKRYGGIHPSGGWAHHYKYICWPIAHALLPRDLQVQLVQAVYRARHHLYIALRQPDEYMGQLVAHYAYYPTHRFVLFLRDKRLAGWIVRTLLRGDNVASGLEPKALARIVKDLKSEGHARAWFTESRGVYQQHSVRPHGGHIGMPESPWLPNFERDRDEAATATRREPELEPKLSLIRTASDKWTPTITIPTFAHLANGNDELLDQLETNRVGVPCHGSKMGPAAALLSPAGLERTMATWPADRTCVVRFDQALPVVDQIVKMSCQLRPASLWLFRVGSDGRAVHVNGTTVRPGERYVVVVRDASKLPALWAPQRIACDGVSAAYIEIPQPVGTALQARLQQAGLSAVYGVSISPVGGVPVGWSPQSLGEWLSTQTPRFRLHRDYEFTHYSVGIENQPSTLIACGSGVDQIVSLVGLREGRHDILISTFAGAAQAGAGAKRMGSVRLSIVIRQPASFAPGRLPLQAMLVTCAPAAPTFAEFISGRVSLRVDGDATREISVRLDLLDASGDVLSAIPICKQRLPIGGKDLRDAVGQTLQHGSEEFDLLNFEAAQIVVDGGDLGLRRIILHQVVQPLRWIYLQERATAALQLVDDLENSAVRVRTASFDRPAQWRAIASNQAVTGMDLIAGQGLYVAANATLEACVVVSPPPVGKGFELFRIAIDPAHLPRSLQETMETYRLWASARVCGLISRYRQRHVLKTLQDHGIGMVAGRRWRELEQSLVDCPTEEDWERLEASAQWGTNYGILLSKVWANSDESGDGLEEQFVTVTMKLRMAEDPAVARCAWRLSGGFHDLYPEDVINACERFYGVLGKSMRGARLLRLYADRGRVTAQMEEACKS